jgi:type IV secretory pathway VirB2 component (pilin)
MNTNSASMDFNPSAKQIKIVKSDLVLFVALIALFAAGYAVAGSDSTFSTFVTTIRNWLTGSFGLLVSLIALVASVLAAMFGELKKLGIAFMVALICTIVPTILVGIFTATI